MHEVTIIEELYLKAIQFPDLIQRAAYLDSACANDPDLRRKVEELLNAHAQVGKFLEPQPQSTQIYSPHGPAPTKEGVLIGNRYKLLEKIGEGGMGEVWVADQAEPIKRRVALKLIKPGMDSRSVLARFEAERQALAVMDHPNIAKVLDAGTTGDGRPYFVMELVKGTPITELADARKLTPTERLELFVPVCQAIQHAHMKGIIHRDIKPSNVLVELHDDRLVPKVIDFGVAKAVGPQLTEKTIYTGFGALVGTPTYMAPEQATFNAIDIDTRADVYALGVVLYELLAGSPPIESERLKKAALDEVLRIVRDEEPPRPSQRLSTSQTKAIIAVTRGSEPMKLSQLMRGELDWIVMKALEKDRTRRYESANGFAADIQRYLAGEQVQAVPPSLGYRLKKAYRRNRSVLMVATAFTALLVGAAVVGGILAMQARRAQGLAEAKRIEAEEQRREAEDNKNAWLAASEAHMEVAIDAEIRGNSARIDADLLEHRSDSRIGLLSLARPLRDSFTIPAFGPNFSGTTTISLEEPEFVKFREFQAAAVIAAGQEFAPLVPPLTESDVAETSPDGRLHLTGCERTGIELIAIPSLKRIGVLREVNERLVKWGFSTDSRTVWTLDTESIFRFWNTDGSFRAKTPQQPERFVYPPGLRWDGVAKLASTVHRILVSDGVAVLISFEPIGTVSMEGEVEGLNPPKVPVDLYSTRTGKLIRRIDRLDQRLSDWQFSPDKRWLIYVDYNTTDPQVVIVSSADGQELARLDHPLHGTDKINVQISPTGKWVLTTDHNINIGTETVPYVERVRLWGSPTWQRADERLLHEVVISMFAESKFPHFVSDNILAFRHPDGVGLLKIGEKVQVVQPSLLGLEGDWYIEYLHIVPNEMIIYSGSNSRSLTDANSFQKLKPPPGRRYAAEFAKLAPDGRFFGNLDTITEKELPLPEYFSITTLIPQYGQAGWYRSEGRLGLGVGPETRTDPYLISLPDPSKLDIPPAMLELWAQVVTGGQLTTDGRFEAWDAPTWQAKQRELAAMTPPYEDFPFPGWVATEPHLWWRIKAYMTQNNEERNKLLDEWLRRSGRVRPEPEPDTWRTPGPDKASDESRPTTSGGSSVSDAPNSLP